MSDWNELDTSESYNNPIHKHPDTTYFEERARYKLKIPFTVLHQHIFKQTENKWIHGTGYVSSKVKFIQSAQLLDHNTHLPFSIWNRRLVLFFFCFISPNPPGTQLYILVAGPSSCGTWDAASMWPDELCYVCAQDRTLGRRSGARELNHSATELAPDLA